MKKKISVSTKKNLKIFQKSLVLGLGFFISSGIVFATSSSMDGEKSDYASGDALSSVTFNNLVKTLKDIFNDNGNIGIGVASPVEKLEVNGNIKSNGRQLYLGENLLYSDNSSALISRSNHDTATQMIFQDLQGTNYGRVYGDGDGQTFGLLDGDTHWSYLAAKNHYTQFLINNSAKMTILNNGNVGIGTDNPIQKLEVNGTGRFIGNLTSNGEIISTSANTYRTVQGNYGTFFRNDGASLWLMLTNAGDQYGGWNGLRPFTVNLSSGNVQIGTSLNINNNLTVHGKIKMTSETTSGDSNNTVATKSYVDNKVSSASASASTSMFLAGWPDAIKCKVGSEYSVLYFRQYYQGRVAYGLTGANGGTWISYFYSTGAFRASDGGVGSTFSACKTNISNVPSFYFNNGGN